jgi:hypothetical protein
MSYCIAHLERTGEQVPAHVLELCLSCFQGHPVKRHIEALGSNFGNNPARQLRQAETARARAAKRRAAVREKESSNFAGFYGSHSQAGVPASAKG